jgi:hypothetical protein
MPQELMLVEKDRQAEIHIRSILGGAFVPLQEENPVNSSNGISY